jgi:sodium-dependent phosphate cotransporter
MSKLVVAVKLILFLIALNCFFVSIKLLGAFKGLGMGYGEKLIVDLASNPAMGLLLGIMVTSIIQSSSTTTSLVVGLVAGGVFGEEPIQAARMAVPVIMGANIGTAVTSTLVSLGHIGNKREFQRAFQAGTVHDFFNLLAVCVWFPLQVATNFLGRIAILMADRFAGVGGLKLANPLKWLTSPQKKLVTTLFKSSSFAVRFVVILVMTLGTFGLLRMLTSRYTKEKSTLIMGFAGVVGLSLLVTLVMHYPQYVYIPETGIFLTALGVLMVSLLSIVALMRSLVIERIGRLFHETIFKSDLRALGLGILVTALVQSSSITTSLAVPLAGAGIITIHHVFPFALGANVGTTITALLAALAAGKPIGLAIAFAHLLFNILGIGVWYPLKKVPIYLSGRLAEFALRNRAAPVAFILTLYFFVPLVLITFLR